MNEHGDRNPSEPPDAGADGGLIEARLRREGATYQGLGQDWVPDAGDVTRRSRRQHQRTRAAAAVALVLLVGLAGVSLRTVRGGSDQRLDLGGADTTAVTPAPVVSTTVHATGVVPTTTTVPATSSTTPPPTASTTPAPPTPSVPPTTAAPTTSAPPTTAGPTTVPTTAVAPANTVTLRGDGLGIVAFGAPEQQVMSRLIVALGMPSADYGWRAANTGIEERANRQVAWEGFIVSFLEDDRGRYFAAWRYSAAPWSEHDDSATPVLSTPDGLRTGMTWGEVAPRVNVAAQVVGEGATGYRVHTDAGPLYLWFDPPLNDTVKPPMPSARIVILDAGDPMSAHVP